MEVIDVIEAFDLGFNLGNVVKYILRVGKKGSASSWIDDLHKAKWYLDRELAQKTTGWVYREKGGSEEIKSSVSGYDWCKGGQCQEPLAPI